MNKEEIVEKIFKKLKELPNETETSIARLVYEEFGEIDVDLFYIYKEICEKIKCEKIVLDYSKWSGQIVGLPYNIEFVKKEK